MAEWDIPAIAQALGGQLERDGTIWTIRLLNHELGVRLKVELDVANRSVRVWADRDRKTRPSFLGRYDLHGVKTVILQPNGVTFIIDCPDPAELTITRSGVMRLQLGDDAMHHHDGA